MIPYIPETRKERSSIWKKHEVQWCTISLDLVFQWNLEEVTIQLEQNYHGLPKEKTTLKSSYLPSPSVRQHFWKTNNKNPSQKEVMLTGSCISSCLLSEKSRGKDLCIWPSLVTDESFETERWPLAQNTHNTSLAELRPAPWPSESSWCFFTTCCLLSTHQQGEK